jgi:hypothetical protein
MSKGSILDMPEDLLEDYPIHEIAKAQNGKRKVTVTKVNACGEPRPIETLIKKVAGVLGIDPQELSMWSKDNPLPIEILKNILLTARRLKLNPLLGHIAWELNKENHWEVYIPIDGWIALIHREPTFKGLTFNQSTETENAIPIWMECTIYRSDLVYPMTVREYYSEVKTDHHMWKQKPRRMLRHKALQQCTRLAFGICVPEFKTQLPKLNKAKNLVTTNNYHANFRRCDSSKAKLKQRLISSMPSGKNPSSFP